MLKAFSESLDSLVTYLEFVLNYCSEDQASDDNVSYHHCRGKNDVPSHGSFTRASCHLPVSQLDLAEADFRPRNGWHYESEVKYTQETPGQ